MQKCTKNYKTVFKNSKKFQIFERSVKKKMNQSEEREGPRMRQLRAGFSKAMDRAMKACKALHMENRFSTLTDSQRPAVAKICEDLICTMKENMEVCFFSFLYLKQYINTYMIQREFDLILAQTKVYYNILATQLSERTLKVI